MQQNNTYTYYFEPNRSPLGQAAIGLNHCVVLNNGVFRDDHYPLANVIVFAVEMFRLVIRRDDAVGADTGVFVDDRLLDAGVLADADARNTFFVTL